MKTLHLICLFLFASLYASATNYYFSTSGSDAGAGTQVSPYKTLAKASAMSFLPGDSVLFKRGDTFYGTLVPKTSGTSAQPIYYGAYSTGAKPVISFTAPLRGWTYAGSNGIWYASLANDPGTLFFDGVFRGKGRYPSSGYLSYETAVDSLNKITDAQLPGTPSWVGSGIVVRCAGTQLQRYTVTAQSGGTLTLSNLDSPNPGFGYFFQNDLKCLLNTGDWMYNATQGKVYMKFGTDTAGHTVKAAASIAETANINGRSYLTFASLHFEGATQSNAVTIKNSNHIRITGCELAYSSQAVGMLDATTDITIDHSNLHDNTNKAVSIPSSTTQRIVIDRCDITNSGMILGAGASGDASYCAVYAEYGRSVTVKNNRIINSGFRAVRLARASNQYIYQNVIDSFCRLKNDGGAIGYWQSSSDSIFYNRLVKQNFIFNASAESDAGTTGTRHAHGLYTDTRSQNIVFDGNVVVNSGDGFHSTNGFKNIAVTNNIFWGNKRYGFRAETYNVSLPFRGNTVTGNVFTCATGVNAMSLRSTANDFSQMGTFANNYFRTAGLSAFESKVGSNGAQLKSLAQWQTAYALEAGSVSVWSTDTGVMRLEMDTTLSPRVVDLADNVYKNVQTGQNVAGTLTLQPYTAVALLWVGKQSTPGIGGSDTLPPVPEPLARPDKPNAAGIDSISQNFVRIIVPDAYGAESFIVWRQTGTGAYGIIMSGVKAGKVTDGNVQKGKTYHYKVQGQNAAGTGPLSDASNAATIPNSSSSKGRVRYS